MRRIEGVAEVGRPQPLRGKVTAIGAISDDSFVSDASQATVKRIRALTPPSGTTVLLNQYDPFSGFFEGADYCRTTFDDEANIPIEAASPPFEGRFRPLAGNALADFDGQDACGAWKFRVYDAFHMDTGCFEAYTLTNVTPEPATVAFLLLGFGLVVAGPARQVRSAPPATQRPPRPGSNRSNALL